MDTEMILSLKINNVQTIKDGLKAMFVLFYKERGHYKQSGKWNVVEKSIQSTLIENGLIEGKVDDKGAIEFINHGQSSAIIESLIKHL